MNTITINVTHISTGFACWCDLLPGWTVSHGNDFGKFLEYARESIAFYVRCAKEDGDEYPSILDGDYDIECTFDVCGLLNYYQGVLTFAGMQKITGVNQKQLAHYAAGRSVPRKNTAEQIGSCLHKFGKELQSIKITSF